MALKDLFSLFDDKLSETFSKKAFDPTKDREKMVKRLESNKSKFLATEPSRGGRKDYEIANSVVSFSPVTPGGDGLKINGKEGPFYVPSERFREVLDHLIAATNAGELDEALQGETVGGDTAPAKTRKPRQPRAPREGGGAGWSDERKAKYAATIAARKAAKGE